MKISGTVWGENIVYETILVVVELIQSTTNNSMHQEVNSVGANMYCMTKNYCL